MEKGFEYKEVQSGLPAERALDLAATIANFVPLIGGPLATILGGISADRKEQRILDVVQEVSDDLRDFQSESAEKYVKTEEFEDLLESTLRRVVLERSPENRRLFGKFLTAAIRQHGGDYDEQVRFLKTIDELDLDHINLLRILLQPPESNLGMTGSPIHTIKSLIPEFTDEHIERLVNGLNDHRVTSLTSLQTMMTARGAADLQHAITPYGRRLLQYIHGA